MDFPTWVAADGKRIAVTGFRSERVTQRDCNQFIEWALEQGFTRKRTYRTESIHRASTLTGTGEYTGITFQVISRPTLHTDSPNTRGRGELRDIYEHYGPDGERRSNPPKIGQCWSKRHRREGVDVMVSCSISGFVEHTNLAGYFDVTWQDVMHIPIRELFRVKPFTLPKGVNIQNPLERRAA